MKTLTDTKRLRERLKNLRVEKGYSLERMEKEISENGDFVSKSTLQRFFGDGDECTEFRFETTIRPICNILLDIDIDEADDNDDVLAMKSFIRLKKDIMEELSKANTQVKIDYAEQLKDETEKFQRSMDFLKNQIILKDERITDLLLMNKELTLTNNKLISQLMNCPLRKPDEEEGC